MYEWVEHEADWYQCTIGSETPQVNAGTGTVLRGIGGKGKYQNIAHARRFQSACEQEAKRNSTR